MKLFATGARPVSPELAAIQQERPASHCPLLPQLRGNKPLATHHGHFACHDLFAKLNKLGTSVPDGVVSHPICPSAVDHVLLRATAAFHRRHSANSRNMSSCFEWPGTPPSSLTAETCPSGPMSTSWGRRESSQGVCWGESSRTAMRRQDPRLGIPHVVSQTANVKQLVLNRQSLPPPRGAICICTHWLTRA